MCFKWDGAKNRRNIEKHGISFEEAQEVFNDVCVITWLDDRFDYGEVREFSLTPKQLMQPNEWMAQFQERITALEQENTRLRTELQVCQRSLASQAGVAELECANALLQAELAEEAQQAVIGREQEKAAQERVAELAKANAVLKRMLDVLATKPELEAFLGQALVAITEQLGSPLSTLWFYDA